MKEIDTRPVIKDFMVRCIEISVPKVALSRDGNHILWTLSVYSLENHPIKKDAIKEDCENFHFMVYDWKRTIKSLLTDCKIPYAINQYFSLDNIFNSPNPCVNFQN